MILQERIEGTRLMMEMFGVNIEPPIEQRSKPDIPWQNCSVPGTKGLTFSGPDM